MFHIEPDSGRVAFCNERVRCRFADYDGHFRDEQEAHRAYARTRDFFDSWVARSVVPHSDDWIVEHVYDPQRPATYKHQLSALDDRSRPIPKGTRIVIENGWVFTKLPFGNFWELIEGDGQVSRIRKGLPVTPYNFMSALENFGGRMEYRKGVDPIKVNWRVAMEPATAPLPPASAYGADRAAFHLTAEGPAMCNAGTVTACRVGGAHFATRDDAQLAHEFAAGPVTVPGGFLKRRRVIDPHVNHLESALQRIAESESELADRDSRQRGTTLFQRLVAEGYPVGLLQRPLADRPTEGRVGVRVSPLPGQQPVAGIAYEASNTWDERRALTTIADSLRAGRHAPDEVLCYTASGLSVFAIKGHEAALFGTGIEYDPLVLAEAAARSRYDGSALAAFEGHKAMVVVTADPLEAQVLLSLKEAHDGGHLRLGDPADLYARRWFFYDDRDLDRAHRSRHIRAEETHRFAMAYVAQTIARMRAMNGQVREVTPQVNDQVADMRNMRYLLDWDVSGREPIRGHFRKDELDRLANRDFTVLPGS